MAEAKGPVFLVGFMGAGKTTTGKALARLLGWDFLDLDELIVAAERRSIAQIFQQDGEAHFRRVETEILAGLRVRPRLVVACGGGTYAWEASRALIDRIGRAVWIQVPLREALARCDSGPARPLLKDEDQAEGLYLARLPAYRSAPLCVEAEGLSPEEIAERVAALL
ncbi:MAG TPA: shikimate kinase [Candidatus Polarisedimenticolia bacterium]|nr:shikimate kinase [Candidatus Polarisedimenticolia bacterium]